MLQRLDETHVAERHVIPAAAILSAFPEPGAIRPWGRALAGLPCELQVLCGTLHEAPRLSGV